MACGVYQILNKVTGKFYLGSSTNIKARIKKHVRQLESDTHHCIYLTRAWKKYGREAFKPVVMVRCKDAVEAQAVEQGLLDTMTRKILYNTSGAATGGNMIKFLSKKDRKRLSEQKSKATRAYIAALSEEERKEKYGLKGAANGMFGRTHNEEAKRRILLHGKQAAAIRERRLGKKLEEIYGAERAKEIRKKMSAHAKTRGKEGNPFYGKKHSAKSRREMSEKQQKLRKEGFRSGNCRKVVVGDLEFFSLLEAARHLGVSKGTICHRIKSKNVKFKDYSYAS